jgi:hypothetical protein
MVNVLKTAARVVMASSTQVLGILLVNRWGSRHRLETTHLGTAFQPTLG